MIIIIIEKTITLHLPTKYVDAIEVEKMVF